MFTTQKSLLAASVIALTLSAGPITAVHAAAHEKDVVIATVNGDKIMKSTLDGYIEILKKQKQGKKTDRQAALDDLVATEIALQEAKKTDILDRPATKKSLSDYTRNILLQTWTKEKIGSFKIDDAAIKEAYDERVTKLASKEFNARHILVKTEDEAKAVIKDANAEGADFAEIAKKKSTGPSGSNGGSLGWFKAQTMVPAFANAVKAMGKGDVSKDPVKTQFGYHVIKLEDSRDAKLPTLESLKPQLERVISQKKMLAYMEGLKKDADIKITLPEEPTVEEKAMEKAKEEAQKAE
ncbi:MAG: peptidyl-prolyl cis-trans isomerase C [Cocleimonas sp.]|jgi:peptidyl-prolyl cis-trans isomerase C